MNAPHPAAVLWDLDGTLIDTEPYWIAAETPLVESYGGTWTDEKALAMVGNGLEVSAEILQQNGVRMGVQEIIDHLTGEVMRRLHEDPVPYRPGARELIEQCRSAGVKMAIVTMSMRRMAEVVAAGIGAENFDVIVAGDDVERPKPYPDAYLRAAELLGVDIAHTVAIEDSPTGVRSAVDAGATVIGVPSMLPLDASGAHQLWPTLARRTLGDLALAAAERNSQR